MATLNKVTMIGRLTKDIELKTNSKGTTYCFFTLAVNEGYGDKKRTIFMDCKVYGTTANFLGKYAKKGTELLVDGKIDKWQAKKEDGTTNTMTDIFCQSVQITSYPKDSVYDSNATKSDEFIQTETEISNFFSQKTESGSYEIEIAEDDLPF